MKRKLTEQWVSALKSGEYHQQTGYLHDEDTGRFCALGVLYDLYSKDTGKPWKHLVGSAMGSPCPMAELKEWAGESSSSPLFSRVVVLNDARESDPRPKSFREIADWLESTQLPQ